MRMPTGTFVLVVQVALSPTALRSSSRSSRISVEAQSGTGVPPVSVETEKTGGTPVPLFQLLIDSLGVVPDQFLNSRLGIPASLSKLTVR
jgi:hypothetical protein